MKITCRVCTVQQGEFFTLDTNVTIDDLNEHKLLEVYNRSFQLKAFLQDCLPQVVCSSCVEKLKEFFAFKLQAEKSDQEFREDLTAKAIEVKSENSFDNYFVAIKENEIPIDPEEEEEQNIEETYEVDECNNDDEPVEEIEDTDILFELYSKNDSCIEKYIKLEKDNGEDIIEEPFIRDESELNVVIQEDNNILSKNKSTEVIEISKPTIEISILESSVSQEQTISLEPLVEIRKWQCSECNRKYMTEEKLIQHQKLHSQSENCECEICGSQLNTLYDYGVHMKTHGMERKFSCEFCDKTFSTRANLKAHLNIHSNLRPFKCEICGKAFQQKSILKTHMTLHTGKPFECTLCQRRFSRTAHLNIHMRQHNNIRPYQCSQCPSAYMQKSHLDRHISSSHLGVRFQCTICGKMYTKKPSLNTHMREAHCSTSSSHNCDICDLEFTKQKGLYYHLKSKHPGYKKMN